MNPRGRQRRTPHPRRRRWHRPGLRTPPSPRRPHRRHVAVQLHHHQGPAAVLAPGRPNRTAEPRLDRPQIDGVEGQSDGRVGARPRTRHGARPDRRPGPAEVAVVLVVPVVLAVRIGAEFHLGRLRVPVPGFSTDVGSSRLRPDQPGWRNGRRGGLKIHCPKGRAGSNPAPGTFGMVCRDIGDRCVGTSETGVSGHRRPLGAPSYGSAGPLRPAPTRSDPVGHRGPAVG